MKTAERYGDDSVVVTVFPDDNKKYLSTDLLHDEPPKPDSIAPQTRLLGFGAFKRVCHTCCDSKDCVQIKALEGSRGESDLPPCPLWNAADA